MNKAYKPGEAKGAAPTALRAEVQKKLVGMGLTAEMAEGCLRVGPRPGLSATKLSGEFNGSARPDLAFRRGVPSPSCLDRFWTNLSKLGPQWTGDVGHGRITSPWVKPALMYAWLRLFLQTAFATGAASSL